MAAQRSSSTAAQLTAAMQNSGVAAASTACGVSATGTAVIFTRGSCVLARRHETTARTRVLARRHETAARTRVIAWLGLVNATTARVPDRTGWWTARARRATGAHVTAVSTLGHAAHDAGVRVSDAAHDCGVLPRTCCGFALQAGQQRVQTATIIVRRLTLDATTAFIVAGFVRHAAVVIVAVPVAPTLVAATSCLSQLAARLVFVLGRLGFTGFLGRIAGGLLGRVAIGCSAARISVRCTLLQLGREGSVRRRRITCGSGVSTVATADE